MTGITAIMMVLLLTWSMSVLILVQPLLLAMFVMEIVTLMLIVYITLSASRGMLMKLFLVVVTVLHRDGITATMTDKLLTWSMLVLILVLLLLLVMLVTVIVTQMLIVQETLSASREMLMRWFLVVATELLIMIGTIVTTMVRLS
jgi:hypothetical protein